MTEQITLNWPGKELLLVSSGDSRYEWAAPNAYAPYPLEIVHSEATVAGVNHGTVICGDALDVMMQSHPPVAEKSVRLLYVDPPFNTGFRFGDYEDAMDSGQWLSMLRDRLDAVKPYLRDDASIWVHLDDSESHRARCVLDEVFGTDSYVATVIWQRKTTRESRSAFSTNHDTILVYAPSGPVSWKKRRNLLTKDPKDLTNRDRDPRGPWADAPFTAPGYRANQQYTIVNPAGNALQPPRGRSWYATEETYRQLLADDRIWFPKNGAGSPRLKLFPYQLRGLVPFSVWSAAETGTNDDGKRHLQTLFPNGSVFATPKPEELLERIIHIATDPGELVMDLFGGSGTTGTTAQKMGRPWVLVERNPQTVSEVLLPRVGIVLTGNDPGGVSKQCNWSGGGSVSVYRVKSGKGRSGKVRIPSQLLATRPVVAGGMSA